MAVKIYNTKSKSIEEVIPLHGTAVGMYTCGMTVYDYAHIGHGRKYTMDDILRRTLSYTGYAVNHVQNVTDVGHLSSDGDEGEDKLEKGAKKTGKTVWEVAEYFTTDFYTAMDKLNILRPSVIAKATEHIPEQIALVERLIEKGIAYDTPEAVYFDVTKFPAYGELSGQKLADKLVAVRDEVETGSYKKNPQDFSLWFKRVGRFSDHAMHWPSPFGEGFPGWHIECSAMSMRYLGESFDIHTGGIDHIPVHHENEIAQSEGATGKPFSKYWVHYAFLNVNGEKMSKSLGNYVRIQDVIDRGIDPIALRYFYLGAHYRSHLNFTWEALEGANEALKRLRTAVALGEAGGEVNLDYRTRFIDHLSSDLDTPKALALLHECLGDSALSAKDKRATMIAFDEVLGLSLDALISEISSEAISLIEKRDSARKEKNWAESDAIRKELEALGYVVFDTPEGTKLTKKS
jgi:cysteinyl-tRNA synthetase